MRKLFFILLALLSMQAQAQSLTKSKILKTTDLGNQKLAVNVQKQDTTFTILFKTANRFQKQFECVLGDRDNALRLLQFLQDLELEKGDIIDLENPSGNYVKKNALGGLLVFSEGGTFSQQLRKPHCKAFIEAIKMYCGLNQPDEDEEGDDDE